MINRIKKHPKIIISTGIILYIFFTTIFCFLKYKNLGYNALDLAIFNNIFFNAAHNNGFWSSIQGHYYFADHFAPYLYVILPLYKLWPSPLFLLLLQSVIISFSTIPVYLIAKKILNKNWAIVLSITWLFNPLLWNINLHEWHILPLAIFFLLFTYYFYLTDNNKLFILFLIFSLLVREDVSIVIFMFSILAIIEKKHLKWILPPALLSVSYFIFTSFFGSILNNGEISRFTIYYQWLLTTDIWHIIIHIIKLGNWEMILGLGISFLFLPFLSRKHLLLLLGPLAQFILGAPGGSNVIINTHYSTLFLPGLIISSIWAIAKIKNKNTAITKILFFDLGITKFISIAAVIIVFFAFGPVGATILNKQKQNTTNQQKQLKKISTNAIVMSGYKYLPNLSSRKSIYSFHYLITGKQQFSDNVYYYQNPEYLIFDTNDFISYELQFPRSGIFSSLYEFSQNMTNIKNLTLSKYQMQYFDNNLLIFKKEFVKNDFEETLNQKINNKKLKLNNFILNTKKENDYLKLFWQTTKQDKENNYFIAIQINNNKFIRPLVFFTPTSLWQTKKTYTSKIFIPANTKNLTIQLIKISGQVEVNPDRGVKNVIKEKTLGPEIKIKI